MAHLWDLVAGAAILIGASGELRYLSGKSVDYLELLDGRLTPEPMIAAILIYRSSCTALLGSITDLVQDVLNRGLPRSRAPPS